MISFRSWAIFAGTIFLLLVITLAIYGGRVFMILRRDAGMALLFSSRTTSSPVKILGLSAIIFLCCSCRSVYNFLSVAGVASFTITAGHKWNPDGIVFLMYFFWEVLPLFIVIAFFWRLPSPNHKSEARSLHAISDDTDPLLPLVNNLVPASPHLAIRPSAPSFDKSVGASSFGSSLGNPALPGYPVLSGYEHAPYFNRFSSNAINVSETGFTPYAITPTYSTFNEAGDSSDIGM